MKAKVRQILSVAMFMAMGIRSLCAGELKEKELSEKIEIREGKYFFAPATFNKNTVPSSGESARDKFHSTAYAVKLADKNLPTKTEEVMNDKGVSSNVNYYEAFKYAVPGDIVWYKGPHIMMISEINGPSGKDGLYRMEDIKILESVYNNADKFYGSTNSRIIENLKVWNESSHSYTYRNWQVWRQKFN